ncbi:MAG: hypothetical protein RLZZ84_1710 [Pseudomonadota bacterium]|jgi:penicillin-binding protein 1A
MIKIDRVSGKRVFEGEPSADPKSSIIWEAFKADAEPKRGDVSNLAQQRDALIAAVRKGAAARDKQGEAAPTIAPDSSVIVQ